MGALNNNNRSRPIHQRTSLTYRKGKTRLRPLSLKQLDEIMQKEKTGKRFDAAKTVYEQKIASGVVWNRPAQAEETE